MADNYLERQRELYEVRKAAWEKKKKYRVKRTTKTSLPKEQIPEGTGDSSPEGKKTD